MYNPVPMKSREEILLPFRLDDRAELHPSLAGLPDGVSEFSFANLYLFRGKYEYRWGRISNSELLIVGGAGKERFFMLPSIAADEAAIDPELFRYGYMRCATERQALALEREGFRIYEDRDNFDYLYRRDDLARLPGRRYHRKKNLIRAFVNRYSCEAMPLTMERVADAAAILDAWMDERDDPGDYSAAKEGLNLMEQLQMCGVIYYVEGRPAAYILGEEMANGSMFVVHFEKALTRYKGLYQFVNRSFASILPEKYEYINREQDLGIPGLRKTKMSYRPCGFVEKFTVFRDAFPPGVVS